MRIKGKAKSINLRRQVLGRINGYSGSSVSTVNYVDLNSYTWIGSTADGVAAEIFVDGETNKRYVLEANENSFFSGFAEIFDETNGKYKIFGFRLSIRRDGSNNTTMTAYETTNIGGTITDKTCWVQFVADDTNEALKCSVQGITGTDISYRVKLNRS